MSDDVVESLRRSKELLGEILPIFVWRDEDVLDGVHRLKAGWESIQEVPITDPLDKLLFRYEVNARRRLWTAEESKAIANEIAEIVTTKGIPDRYAEKMPDELKARLAEGGRVPIGKVADFVAWLMQLHPNYVRQSLLEDRFKLEEMARRTAEKVTFPAEEAGELAAPKTLPPPSEPKPAVAKPRCPVCDRAMTKRRFLQAAIRLLRILRSPEEARKKAEEIEATLGA